ncbi:phage tail tape measure protein [Desulfuromonas thiophila]|uniref:phage tail tape measure protein n=1 Tax=Desulfuromonas thiophila TaxID=57664 RepID=UPI0029F464E7|nr:phage tail tape measure protein [Desulfuromonas thiophila]
MSTSVSDVDRLGNRFRQLEATTAKMKAFRTLGDELPGAAAAWEKASADVADYRARLNALRQSAGPLQARLAAARQRVDELTDAVNRSASPSKQMRHELSLAKHEAKLLAAQYQPVQAEIKDLTRAMNTAGRSAAGAKKALESKRASLTALSADLTRAGHGTVLLAQKEARLQQELKKTEARYTSLKTTMDKIEAVKNRRAELRGKMFDTVALGASLAAPLNEAIAFESAMADVAKVVNFPAPDGLQQMGAQLTRMTREIPISATGLAQIAAAGGQLGIAAKDLPDFTETVAKMATAFDMAPDAAGDAMAKLSNVYQIPIGEMNRLGDAINHLSDNTAAKAQDLVPVLARVGGTAKQFGLGAVQVAALGNAFIALGKPPEVAGTAINAMLTKLQTATRQGKSFQQGLAAMGMSAADLEANIAQNGQAALEGFLENLSRIDGQDRAGILADMFGMEYADDVSLLAGSLDKYRQALALVREETSYAGSMQREFANRSKTTANQLELAKNGLKEVGINLGSTLLPVVNDGLGVFRAGTTALADFSQRFPLVTKVVTMATAALIAGKVAAVGLGYGMTFVKESALMARTVLLRAGWATSALTARLKASIIWQKAATAAQGLWTAAVNLSSAAGARAVVMQTALMARLKASVIWQKAATAAQWLWNAALTANPIGLIITGAAALIGLGVALYQKWEPFRNLVNWLWEKITAFVSMLPGIGLLKEAWDFFAGGDDEEAPAAGQIPPQLPVSAIPGLSAAPASPVVPLPQPPALTISAPAAPAIPVVPAGAGRTEITFSPTITIPAGAATDMKEQVSQALSLSFDEFKQFMARYERDRARRSFA